MEVARPHPVRLDELGHVVGLDGPAELVGRHTGQDALVDHPVAAFEDLPALCLQSGIASDGLDGVGVRMDLEREYGVGVEQLEQQRESPVGHGRRAAEKPVAERAGQVRQRGPRGRAVGDPADALDEVGKFPAFADAPALGQLAAEKTLKVPPAPDLLFVDRREFVWTWFHGQAAHATANRR